MKPRAEIVSIVPAPPGWRALFAIGESEGSEDAKAFEQAIVCWALVDDGKYGRYIAGYTADQTIEAVEDDADFVRYLSPGEQASAYADEVGKAYAAIRGREMKSRLPVRAS